MKFLKKISKPDYTKKIFNLKKFRLRKIKKITPTTKETMFLFLHKEKHSKIIKEYI
jgi:hypothetical protein